MTLVTKLMTVGSFDLVVLLPVHISEEAPLTSNGCLSGLNITTGFHSVINRPMSPGSLIIIHQYETSQLQNAK